MMGHKADGMRTTIPLDFPGVTATLSAEALVLCSQQPLQTLSSAVVGGGFLRARYIVNRHVHKDYCHPEPAADLLTFARSHGIAEAFVGLMTAVPMHKTRTITVREAALTVSVVVTAGLSNPAAPGFSPPAVLRPSTINLILLLDACLSPAAMMNAGMTATEVKTQVLLKRGVLTPEGYAATGTSTDAVIVACPEDGEVLPYAGPVTTVGWLIGRGVRAALEAALA
jgi:iron complex transport system ATP-binding protein